MMFPLPVRFSVFGQTIRLPIANFHLCLDHLPVQFYVFSTASIEENTRFSKLIVEEVMGNPIKNNTTVGLSMMAEPDIVDLQLGR